jgi:hypothetical protein
MNICLLRILKSTFVSKWATSGHLRQLMGLNGITFSNLQTFKQPPALETTWNQLKPVKQPNYY